MSAPQHLCPSCDHFRAGRCVVAAPAAEKLTRREAVLSCGSYVEEATGRRELFEGGEDGGHSSR